VKLLVMVGSENVEVRDVLLRDSAGWNAHLIACKDIALRGVRILADWAVGNTDGINPDCCQNVTIDDYFAFCGDDAVAVKTTLRSAKLSGCDGITVRNALVMTRKTAFKIGTETYRDISNVLFENCEAVHSSRGVGVYVKDGGAVSKVTYRDLRLGLREYPGEPTSGAACTMEIGKRGGVGSIRDVLFERVSAEAPYGSSMAGRADSRIGKVAFKDCTMDVTDRAIKLNSMPVFALRNCADIDLAGLRVRWRTKLREPWTELIAQENCERVKSFVVEE
jgi:hypothetical protein